MSEATIDVEWMKRDLYGYGPDRPDAQWPNGKKIAVNCELTNLCRLEGLLIHLQLFSIMKRAAREAAKTAMNMQRLCFTSLGNW